MFSRKLVCLLLLVVVIAAVPIALGLRPVPQEPNLMADGPWPPPPPPPPIDPAYPEMHA